MTLDTSVLDILFEDSWDNLYKPLERIDTYLSDGSSSSTDLSELQRQINQLKSDLETHETSSSEEFKNINTILEKRTVWHNY